MANVLRDCMKTLTNFVSTDSRKIVFSANFVMLGFKAPSDSERLIKYKSTIIHYIALKIEMYSL